MRKLSLILILTSVALLAAPPAGMTVPQPSSGYRLLGEITDDPAWTWLIWWTGVGNIRDFTVSNFALTGLIGRNWQYKDLFYEGEPITLTDDDIANGKVAEYPPGSKQFYSFSCGLWFGALYTSGGDTWSPGISRTGPYGDLGAMSAPEMEEGGGMGNIASTGLYFADMHIPEGYTGEGDFLFVYPDRTQKSYQVLWPFADTTLNKNRPPDDQLDPSEGDMVSHEDTYAVGGDWIAEDFAVMPWFRHDSIGGPYLGPALGLRFEQRTYSWSRDALANAIVLNYKIRNMNDHELKAPYVSFFMDNDIGTGGSEPGDDGAWDDQVGYNSAREACYTYDSNGSESGWSPPPGYIGVVFLDTPEDVGATGLDSWNYGSPEDTIYGWSWTDSLKYLRMQSTNFKTWDEPNDIRMLLNSGPYPDMAPGDEYDYTLAIVVGADLDEFLANADAVKAAFNQGFPWIGIEEDETTAPGAPVKLNLTAANISDGLIGLRYLLPHASDINISVFDATGRKVQTLKQGHTLAGSGEIAWNAFRVPSGVYFVRLSACGSSCTERVVIVR